VISTPCIKICAIDQASLLCAGCGRSLEEIARWGAMTELQRRDVMRVLAERMRVAGLKPQQATLP
jgi:predicted Fe-S protein YdhL (DUF1289 family)